LSFILRAFLVDPIEKQPAHMIPQVPHPIKKPRFAGPFYWMGRLERLCRASLPGTPTAGLQPAFGAARCASVQNRSEQFCRTPDRSVRSPTGKIVSYYRSTACRLDQPQNVVKVNVNEPYLVLHWYIIVTYNY